jgi:hypothetical protein
VHGSLDPRVSPVRCAAGRQLAPASSPKRLYAPWGADGCSMASRVSLRINHCFPTLTAGICPRLIFRTIESGRMCSMSATCAVVSSSCVPTPSPPLVLAIHGNIMLCIVLYIPGVARCQEKYAGETGAKLTDGGAWWWDVAISISAPSLSGSAPVHSIECAPSCDTGPSDLQFKLTGAVNFTRVETLTPSPKRIL